MRLACLELRQVLLAYRVLRQVNQFYLAPVRSTKVPARLFHQICWNACLWQALSGLLRYYRSDLGDHKLHVAKSEH